MGIQHGLIGMMKLLNRCLQRLLWTTRSLRGSKSDSVQGTFALVANLSCSSTFLKDCSCVSFGCQAGSFTVSPSWSLSFQSLGLRGCEERLRIQDL